MSTSNRATGPTGDFCTLAPDAPLGFDFSAACYVHDLNYGSNSSVSRQEADQIFYNSMRNICDTQYGGSGLCHWAAKVYFVGVRMFGDFFYEGPGG